MEAMNNANKTETVRIIQSIFSLTQSLNVNNDKNGGSNRNP
jgi:hypothetical protein